MKQNGNGYRVILFRQTEKGYDVISPYQLNKTVAKEVYENVLGIVENPENGNGTGKGTKRDKETIRVLQKKLEETNARAKLLELFKEESDDAVLILEKQVEQMKRRIEKADTVKEQLNAVMVQIKKVANGI